MSSNANAGFGQGDALTWPVSRIRQEYIDFFRDRHEHTFVPSSPVVPHDDPTLLFANAGMNQFKPIFLGQVDPTSPLAQLRRAVNTQKCIRAGGKHNDLEDVGKDTYHHTFFEMMGNWSFSDYFKEESITWCWQLLTEVYGLPQEQLYATYFEGDEDVPVDEEARDIWLRFLPPERVIGCGKGDNFWEMGETGPCGPCSEVHFDRIGGRDASHLVNADVADVVEIWNLVFMQFFRDETGSLSRLPHNHVDTGMGLERVTSILQGKRSNYDTDVFLPLFEAIQRITGCREYQGKLGAEDVDGVDMAYRVIADHARTITFAVCDGAVPSKEGRGYVLRRILRRAVRYGRQMLNAPTGFFSELVPVVVEAFKEAFPELDGKSTFIHEVVLDEEESFGRTLDRGLRRFHKMVDQLKRSGATEIPGDDAFFLYDSMGFPLDLTQLMAEEAGMRVDEAGFHAAMAEQKRRSQQAAASGRGGAGRLLALEAEQTATLAREGAPTTVDELKYRWHISPSARVVAVYTKEHGFLPSDAALSAEDAPAVVGVILDRTPFYATAGGQETDMGRLKALPSSHPKAVAYGEDKEEEDGMTPADDEEMEGGGAVAELDVENVRSFAGYVLHMGSLQSGSLRVGDVVECQVDYDRRSLIAPNHTMTHVLNFALRKVLGSDVDQKGSAVLDDKLRFDFNHNKAMTAEQLARVEEICNRVVDEAMPVFSKVVPLNEARAIHSLRAVFGETYPDPVRVVSVGKEVEPMLEDPENPAWMDYSVEFCGGTHLSNTARAEAFAVAEESSIAKGIRRVTCVTRDAAKECMDKGAEMTRIVHEASMLPLDRLEPRIVELKAMLAESQMQAHVKMELRDEIKKLEKQVAKGKKEEQKARQKRAEAEAGQAVRDAMEREQRFVVMEASLGADPKVLKSMLAAAKKVSADMPVLVFGKSGADPTRFALSAQVPTSLHSQLSAVDWIARAVEGADATVRGKEGQAVVEGVVSDDALVERMPAIAAEHAGSVLER